MQNLENTLTSLLELYDCNYLLINYYRDGSLSKILDLRAEAMLISAVLLYPKMVEMLLKKVA